MQILKPTPHANIINNVQMVITNIHCVVIPKMVSSMGAVYVDDIFGIEWRNVLSKYGGREGKWKEINQDIIINSCAAPPIALNAKLMAI